MTTSKHGLVIRTLVAAAAVSMFTAGVDAQVKREKKKPPATAVPQPPIQPGVAPVPTEPVTGKVLIRENLRDWSVRGEIHIQAGTVLRQVDKAIVVEPKALQFKTVAIVFPVIESSASHELRSPAMGGQKLTGAFYFNEAVIDDKAEIAGGYPAGTRLARWEGRNLNGREADLKVQMEVNCYETRYDDAVAETIPWPTFLPPVAQSAMKPQMFVDFLEKPEPEDTKTIKEFLDKATEGQAPKSIPPAQLAKFLAGQVMEAIQPTGDGLVYNTRSQGLAGTVKGFALKGAAQTLRDGRGSEHDITCVVAAVYKAAGIPARTVIGWDSYSVSGDRLGRSDRTGFRSWVEFCLIDPRTRQEIWIPVDVFKMRKNGSRAKALDQPWPYFGSNEDLGYVIPLAFQFHPPTTVVNMVPALWAWLTDPESEPFANNFNFVIFRTPRTVENPGPDQDQGR